MNSRCLKLYRAYVIRQMLANFFLELSSKGLYQSSGKEKEKCCLCSRPRQNVKFGTFTLWSGVMHVQSQSKPIGFCRSRCRGNRRCLSSLFPQYYGGLGKTLGKSF